MEILEDLIKQKDGLKIIEQEIILLFSNIKNTNNIKEAEEVFKKLDLIQTVLAKSFFKEEIEITPFLRQFIYDFDRIDDSDVKKYIYNKLKNEN